MLAERVLTFADEGITEAWNDEEDEDTAWRDGPWRKDRAVWRASFAEGVPELWAEEEIPDLPRALKESIEDAFDAPARSATNTQGARETRDR